MTTPSSLRLEQRRATLALLVMVMAAVLAWFVTPTHRLAAMHGSMDLEAFVPKQFGEWRLDTATFSGIVNPQQEAQLKALYSQTLSRTYVNGRGQRVMLSIAYGEDQRDAMQLHYPEVCYPAQGFQLKSKRIDAIHVAEGQIPVRRLETSFGGQRFEPVTYWTVIGDRATLGGLDKKFIEIGYGMKGVIVDGLLFRVSSIDRDTSAAFQLQDRFVNELVSAMTPAHRLRLAGLPQ